MDEYIAKKRKTQKNKTKQKQKTQVDPDLAVFK